MTPKITVVVPTFNRKDSLRATLRGLEQQSLLTKYWEAVIVSDGSTDDTDRFLAEYAASAPFTLRAIRQDNAGPSRARNEGIQQAQGDIVVFVDDDVEPSPEFLAVHLDHHESDANVAVIGPLAPDPKRRPSEPVWIGWEHAMLEKQYAAFRKGEWAVAGPHHFYSGNASVRRKYLLDIGGFDTTFTRQEDVELATRLQRECGIHFCFDANAAALHRPTRNWNAWLKVPSSYGQLDVIRARRGDLGWERIQAAYETRNRLTRLLTRVAIRFPRSSDSNRLVLRASASILYNLRREPAAYAALSAVYNTHYLEGAFNELKADERCRLILS